MSFAGLEAFRQEVRGFLDEALTQELRDAGRRCSGIFTDYPLGIKWHRILAAKGWSTPHWPVEHGGTGWSPMQHYVFASELAEAGAPPLAPMGTHMVGPVIIAFGDPAQKQYWLPRIRSGEDYWAQGYSEPHAGSDLAALQCKAVRDGDEYVINGTKIWTTHAQYANRMFCLVRTSVASRPQQGISFLCFDFPRPGITVRPIISMSGDHELNQVFFDDVRVPASGLIGDENQGWSVAKYLLQHERGGAWAPQLRARLMRLRAAVADSGPAAGSFERFHIDLRLAAARARIDALHALELETMRELQAGAALGIQPSMGKVLGSELRQHLTELGLEIAGCGGHARVPMELCGADPLCLSEPSVFATSAYLNDRAASIYAGTNEVQRNLIAAHLLD
jgi:alkylation response protein AidB-like acyl-CoA dehydrogenase